MIEGSSDTGQTSNLDRLPRWLFSAAGQLLGGPGHDLFRQAWAVVSLSAATLCAAGSSPLRQASLPLLLVAAGLALTGFILSLTAVFITERLEWHPRRRTWTSLAAADLVFLTMSVTLIAVVLALRP